MKYSFYLLSVLTMTPLLAHGAALVNFKGFVGIITNIISTLIVLVFALTFIVFMWGVVKSWIIGGGDTENIESGKKIVVTGIIVLAVMSAIWGILALIQRSLFG